MRRTFGSIRIVRRPGGGFRLTGETWVPRPIEEVFEFFSDARNLETITPRFLRFRLQNPSPIAVRQGTVIDYHLRVHGLPLRWRSEITVWERPHRFVDEQRRGPYRRWIHEHSFAEHEGGTLVGDRVDYALWIGRFGVARFVERDVRAIFAYRQQALATRFSQGVATEGG